MALKECVGKVKAGKPFGNKVERVVGVWDFAEDGGATTDTYAVLEAVDDIVIEGFHGRVLTACTSGGSATIDLGIHSGDTDLLLDGVAVAALTLDSLHQPFIVATEGTPNVIAHPIPFKLASGGKISMVIATAALTAGKIEFAFLVSKF